MMKNELKEFLLESFHSNVTPLHIELMIHYHCVAAPVEHSEAPAVKGYTRDLLLNELIREDGKSRSGYYSTPKGKAYVEKLCCVDFPELVVEETWV